MMTKRSILICLLVVSLFAGCQRFSREQSERPQVEVAIAVAASLAPFVERERDAFLAQLQRDSRAPGVTMSLLVGRDLPLTQDLARGTLKPAGWITTWGGFVALAAALRTNLGAPFIDCVPLGATPLVAALPRSAVARFTDQGIISSLAPLFPNEETVVPTDSLRWMHTAPQRSPTGVLTVAFMGARAARHLSTPLPPTALEAPASIAALTKASHAVARFAADDHALLEALLTPSGSATRAALTTEREVARFNRSQGAPPPIVAAYPRDGSPWLDLRFCTSDADWVAPQQREVIARFARHLQTPPAQLRLREDGYRPIDPTATGGPPLSEEFGVSLDHPAITIPAPEGGAMVRLFELIDRNRRPLHLVTVVDTSGSMADTKLRLTVDELRKIAVATSDRRPTALIAFSTEARDLLPFSSEPMRVVQALDRLHASGGSALYDAILRALDTAALAPREARRAILVVTDGDDKNSAFSLAATVNAVRERSGRGEIDLAIIAFDVAREARQPLDDLATAAGGILLDANVATIGATLEEVVATIEARTELN